MIRRPPKSPLFPSPPLSRSLTADIFVEQRLVIAAGKFDDNVLNGLLKFTIVDQTNVELDRKSTRLNSSHGYISYAVFCLKKKKNQQHLNVRPAVTCAARCGT